MAAATLTRRLRARRLVARNAFLASVIAMWHVTRVRGKGLWGTHVRSVSGRLVICLSSNVVAIVD